MPWLEPVTLRSPPVSLEPLARSHLADLVDSVLDGELWKLWYTTIPEPDQMGAETKISAVMI